MSSGHSKDYKRDRIDSIVDILHVLRQLKIISNPTRMMFSPNNVDNFIKRLRFPLNPERNRQHE